MYITYEEIISILSLHNIKIKGGFHIGSHDCEELAFYNKLGLANEEIIWIDAILSKVNESKNKGIPNVYNALITDQDDTEMTFNISNNVQSSSVFEFGTHLNEHPWVVYVDKIQLKSITVDSFFERNQAREKGFIAFPVEFFYSEC